MGGPHAAGTLSQAPAQTTLALPGVHFFVTPRSNLEPTRSDTTGDRLASPPGGQAGPFLTLGSSRSRWFPALAGLVLCVAFGLTRRASLTAPVGHDNPPLLPRRSIAERGPPRA